MALNNKIVNIEITGVVFTNYINEKGVEYNIELKPGDICSAIETGDGRYYILEYRTNDLDKINRMDEGQQIVGSYINIEKYRPNLLVEDSGITANYNEIETEASKNRDQLKFSNGLIQKGDNKYGEQHLNTKFQTNVGVVKNIITGENEPAVLGFEDKVRSLTTYKSIVKPVLDYSEQHIGSAIYNTVLSNSVENNVNLRIENLQNVFGIPHQFTAITDIRFNQDNAKNDAFIGRSYGTKILKNLPLLIITPGEVKYNTYSDISKAQQLGLSLTNAISSFINGRFSSLEFNAADRPVEGRGMKYYALEFAYVEYFKYVNIFLRLAAHFLNLNNEEVANGKKATDINWLYWMSDSSDNAEKNIGNKMLNLSFDSVVGSLQEFFTGSRSRGSASIRIFGKQSVCLYANCGEAVTDSFSNEINTSTFAQTINSWGDSIRQAQFVAGGLSGGKVTGESLGNISGILEEYASNGGKNTGILQNIFSKAQTVLSGGRLVFPQIWSNSTFVRNYSVNMKLVSPSGDKLSIFLNILVPIYHILALMLPRQSFKGAQGFKSPFLIKAYYKGFFNIDVGIIDNLTISKGAEGEWTVDGLPTVAEIQFSIKDMYDQIFMSGSAPELFTNIMELDYIANSCAINIDDGESGRAIKIFNALTSNKMISDTVDNTIASLGQWLNNAFNNSWFSNWR